MGWGSGSDRVVGSRRRKMLAIGGAGVLASAAALVSIGVLPATPAHAVSITSTCTTNLGITSDNTFNVSVTMPATVTQGVSFDATINGGPTTLKAVNVLPITDYRDLYTTYTITGGTMTVAPTPAGQPKWKGVTVSGSAVLDSSTQVSIKTAGPLLTGGADGILDVPNVAIHIVPTAAGTPVKVFAKVAGTTANIGTVATPNLVVATCLLGTGTNPKGSGPPTQLGSSSVVAPTTTSTSTSTSTSTTTVEPTTTTTTVEPTTTTTEQATTTTTAQQATTTTTAEPTTTTTAQPTTTTTAQPTTTTTAAQSTTTTTAEQSTTTSTVIQEGSTTTTFEVSPSSTVTPSTVCDDCSPSTVGPQGSTTTTTVAHGSGTLPFTGGPILPLVIVSISMIGAGIALQRRRGTQAS